MAFENIEGKGENAGNQHFLPFPQCFLPFPKQILIFQSHLVLLSAKAFNLDQSKIESSGNGLTLSQTIHFRFFQTERVCRRQF